MTAKSTIKVKICGVKTAEILSAAVDAGADYVGFMHYERSPRYIAPKEAEKLAALLPAETASVAVFVDPRDEEIKKVASWADWIQLHGHESPRRCAEIAKLVGKPLIKAITVSEKRDIENAHYYRDMADKLLFDASLPDAEGRLPGGNGVPFDWRLLQWTKVSKPWMLSGGLTPETVEEAIEATGAKEVDVSSGVEVTRGEKSAERVRAFIEAAKR